jgi:hypothetical protein
MRCQAGCAALIDHWHSLVAPVITRIEDVCSRVNSAALEIHISTDKDAQQYMTTEYGAIWNQTDIDILSHILRQSIQCSYDESISSQR